jgi:hypothetical protein
MKRSLLILLLLTASAFAQSEVATTPAPRPRLTDALRQRASRGFAAPADRAAPKIQPSGQAPVLMAPFIVTGKFAPLYDRPIATEPDDHPFTWRTGGTILENVGPTFTTIVKFQYDPAYNRVNLLKFSW